MSSNITITFPDGNTREVPKGISGLELAEQISKSLAKESIATGSQRISQASAPPVTKPALDAASQLAYANAVGKMNHLHQNNGSHTLQLWPRMPI